MLCCINHACTRNISIRLPQENESPRRPRHLTETHLGYFLKKCDLKVWTEPNEFRIRFEGGLSYTRQSVPGPNPKQSVLRPKFEIVGTQAKIRNSRYSGRNSYQAPLKYNSKSLILEPYLFVSFSVGKQLLNNTGIILFITLFHWSLSTENL